MSFKDLSIMLIDATDATGYKYDFLVDMVEEAVADGESYPDAVKSICEIAYERDF